NPARAGLGAPIGEAGGVHRGVRHAAGVAGVLRLLAAVERSGARSRRDLVGHFAAAVEAGAARRRALREAVRVPYGLVGGGVGHGPRAGAVAVGEEGAATVDAVLNAAGVEARRARAVAVLREVGLPHDAAAVAVGDRRCAALG